MTDKDLCGRLLQSRPGDIPAGRFWKPVRTFSCVIGRATGAWETVWKGRAQKRLDFPTFPQPLLIIFDLFKMNSEKTSHQIHNKVLYLNKLHGIYHPQILPRRRILNVAGVAFWAHTSECWRRS
jgi:hypothetical protein